MKKKYLFLFMCIIICLYGCNHKKVVIPDETASSQETEDVNSLPELELKTIRHTIALDASKIAVIMEDGTVKTAGTFKDIPWSDGTVSRCLDTTDEWKDMESLAVNWAIYGIDSDGNILETVKLDSSEDILTKMRNIKYIDYSDDLVGIDDSGKIVVKPSSYFARTARYRMWNDIVKVTGYMVALDSKGKVYFDKKNDNTFVNPKWSDMIDVASNGWCAFGVRRDGRVFVVADVTEVSVSNRNERLYDVGNWTDIVAIFACNTHTVGLKSDGTVVAVGSNTYGECNVSEWTDIVDIAVTNGITAGLKSDGTLLVIGNSESGVCDINGMTGVKLPDEYVKPDCMLSYDVSKAIRVTGYYTPVNDDKNDSEGDPFGGFGMSNPKNGLTEPIVYDGTPIELEITLNNHSVDTELGLLFCINGIPQRYTTSNDNEPDFIHVEKYGANETRSIKAYLTPNTGNIGDKVYLRIYGAYNPKIQLTGRKSVFPATELIGGGGGVWSIEIAIKADTAKDFTVETGKSTNVKFTAEELKKLVFTDNHGVLVDKLERFMVAINNDYKIEKNTLNINQDFYGGENGEYIVSAVLNGYVIKSYKINITGRDNKAVIKDSIVFTQEEIEKYKISEWNTFYFIAVSSDKEGGYDRGSMSEIPRTE